jgi:acyl-CoA dehydrogenase
MQRRRVHGVMADPSFNPRAMMDDEPIEFTKAMETIDTVQGPPSEAPQMATVG